jgi:hypothetical protein
MSGFVTLEEFKKIAAHQSKYKNVKAEVDGLVFDSKREARRYQHLKMLERAGEISNLAVQPRFVLQEAFTDTFGERHRAIIYVADFQYIENGSLVVEDAKGHQTREFKIKRKLFLAKFPHELRLT